MKKIGTFLKKLRAKNKLSVRDMGFGSSSTPSYTENSQDENISIKSLKQYALKTETDIVLTIKKNGTLTIKKK